MALLTDNRRFILWNSKKDGDIPRDNEGKISVSGALGLLPRNDFHLTVPLLLTGKCKHKPALIDSLQVGERIYGAKHATSGVVGFYHIYRVE
jgi:hypothetical protein